MKKIAGLLLLTAAVILTAGCVTTADPIVGSWQTTEPIQFDGYTLSYQATFDEDGTGVETIYEPGEEPDVCRISWKEYAENQIVIRHLYTYSFEDGKMKTSRGQNTVFEEVDGIWVETPQVGNHVTTYEFCDDGICVRHIYDGETNERIGFYKYYYIPSVMTDEKIAALPLLTPLLPLFSTPIGGVLLSADIYELEFLEDGTLQDVEDREILERVSSA